jgi:CRP-like cAMP-binding protein
MPIGSKPDGWFSCVQDSQNRHSKLSSGRQSAPDRAELETLVATSPWGRSLSPSEIARVSAELSERRVEAGGYVIEKGKPVSDWMGVIDGLVKMSSDAPSGKTITFAGIAPGGWFGEGSLLKDEFWKYDAIAIRASRIACLPRAAFMRLLETSIPFNRFLLEQLNERLSHFIGLVEFDRLLEPDARVARCIASLFNPRLYPGVRTSLAISQEEIGYLCALSRQRVNPSRQVLEEARLLDVEYRRITVSHQDGLRRFDR